MEDAAVEGYRAGPLTQRQVGAMLGGSIAWNRVSHARLEGKVF
jgi:hypothetical protein